MTYTCPAVPSSLLSAPWERAAPTRSEQEVLVWREQKQESQVGVVVEVLASVSCVHYRSPGFDSFAAEFSIWTREAGAGGLSIAVEGPSKAEIAFEDRKDGSSGVSYIVQEPGEMDRGLIGFIKYKGGGDQWEQRRGAAMDGWVGEWVNG